MPGKLAYMVFQLMEEKQRLIQMLKSQTYKHDRIFNSTHDGMIFIDVNETIILFNQMAEKMVGQKREDVIGRQIKDVVPNTKAPRILETREPEYNQKQTFSESTCRLSRQDCRSLMKAENFSARYACLKTSPTQLNWRKRSRT